ncbi:MAG TPA: hypothetical protein VEY92_13835 [Pseudoxanthomonas sp.]|nr:hypothetical protein [Pseudoxanthomonas sp.]
MKQSFSLYVGVLLWTIAAVMAVNAFLQPSNFPPGWPWRVGIYLITAAFGFKVLHGLLWSSARGHWAAFAMVGLFLMYTLLLYLSAMPGITNTTMQLITVAFTFVPLIGLFILKGYQKSKGKAGRKSSGFFDA